MSFVHPILFWIRRPEHIGLWNLCLGMNLFSKALWAVVLLRQRRRENSKKRKFHFYQHHEIPPSKFPGPFDREVQEDLEKWSFDRGIRGEPHHSDLNLSPCTSLPHNPESYNRDLQPGDPRRRKYVAIEVRLSASTQNFRWPFKSHISVEDSFRHLVICHIYNNTKASLFTVIRSWLTSSVVT